MLGQVATRDLQCEIAPEKDTRDGSGLLRIQVKISADARQGKGNIGAIDEGNRIHDERDGNDPNPAD